jgi:hypothetical protein
VTPAARPMSAYGSPWGVGSWAMRRESTNVAERGVGGLEKGRVGSDSHRLYGFAGRKREVDLQPVGDADLDLTRRLLEALELGVDLVDARDEVGCLEEADLVGDDGDRCLPLLVHDGDGSAGDHAAARILDRAGDRAAGFLCRGGRRYGERGRGRQREREGQQAPRRVRCGTKLIAGSAALKAPPDVAAALSRQPCHSLPPLMASCRKLWFNVQRTCEWGGLIDGHYMIYDCGNTSPFRLCKWSHHLPSRPRILPGPPRFRIAKQPVARGTGWP